jgi:hypothetical protein
VHTFGLKRLASAISADPYLHPPLAMAEDEIFFSFLFDF